MPNYSDPAKVRKALDMIKAGSTQTAAAKEAGVNRAAVARWVKDPERFLKAGGRSNKKRDAPAQAPASAPGPSTLRTEYVPAPKVPAPQAQAEDVDECGNCHKVLNGDERPRECPGCGYALLWPERA